MECCISVFLTKHGMTNCLLARQMDFTLSSGVTPVANTQIACCHWTICKERKWVVQRAVQSIPRSRPNRRQMDEGNVLSTQWETWSMVVGGKEGGREGRREGWREGKQPVHMVHALVDGPRPLWSGWWLDNSQKNGSKTRCAACGQTCVTALHYPSLGCHLEQFAAERIGKWGENILCSDAGMWPPHRCGRSAILPIQPHTRLCHSWNINVNDRNSVVLVVLDLFMAIHIVYH